MIRFAWMVAGAAALLLDGCGNDGSRRAPREEPLPFSASPAEASAVEVRVAPAEGLRAPDEELVDQDGAPVRLRELLADRVVVVNFVFTTCTTICSPMTAIFAKLQGELGDAMERRVRLVTISLDPTVDTPDRLKRYADRFDRRKGWTFLTGRPERVGHVLDALGGRAPVKESHAPLTLIGSVAEGRWTRIDGIAPARRLAEEIQAFSQRAGPVQGGVR